MDRPLFCIVADPAQARLVKPDISNYSPKELAAKERVSLTTVYNWVREGLPVMRQGRMGNILVNYQDYVRWMIECARDPDTDVSPPVWAYWFLRNYPKMVP